VAYPTDSGPLAKAVGKIAPTVQPVRATCGATRTRSRDRRRAAGRRACSIASKLNDLGINSGGLKSPDVAARSRCGAYAGNSHSIAARLLSTYLSCPVSLPYARSSKTLHLA
jgi:hypothetical protein